jgi:hypothetical protein
MEGSAGSPMGFRSWCVCRYETVFERSVAMVFGKTDSVRMGCDASSAMRRVSGSYRRPARDCSAFMAGSRDGLLN